jgi:hypothetical protein
VRCRNGLIQRLFLGAYVDFSGPVPWESRVWAAWLAFGPDAAIAGETALRWYGFDGVRDDDVIRLEIPHERRLRRQAGVAVTRRRDLDCRLLGSREPPMVRLEVAVLTVASRRRRPEDAVALVLDSCRQRRTTPQRLLAELDRLPRLRRRALLIEVLRDAAGGTESFLEYVYLHKVERAHGLPTAARQVRADGSHGVVYRDTQYEEYGVIVELDGRAGHEAAGARWRDMSRDNAALMEAKLTLRFGYQLVGDPCAAAAQVAQVLHSRGWRGVPAPCCPSCPVPALFAALPASSLRGLGNAAHAK